MFQHMKQLQFDARVSEPDPIFARLLLEQFGGPNGELKAAMQYFVQAFCCKSPYPDKYDMLMDIATEELGHLEIVGATITMLCNGINGELKNAEEKFNWMKSASKQSSRDEFMQLAFTSAEFLTNTGGGPSMTNCMGVPWSGVFVNANGDLTVDLRSNIAAESRAKIVYEYLMQFTNDPHVEETIGFLMTREVAHFQMFSAALDSIADNFPPGVLQGDPRFTHTYFNMSNGTEDFRGPWNEGQGPWQEGEWVYVDEPKSVVDETAGLIDQNVEGTSQSMSDVEEINHVKSQQKSGEVKKATSGKKATQWSTYSKKQ